MGAYAGHYGNTEPSVKDVFMGISLGVLASFPAFQCCAQKKYHSVCNIEELGGPGDEMGGNFWQDLIMS